MARLRLSRRSGAYLLLGAVAAAAWGPSPAEWPERLGLRTTITLLYTTDVRGYLEDCG